jgi:type I restriction enzyme R subunit
LKVLEKLGYTRISRGDAEQKRGSRKNVLFEGELETFLSKLTYPYGSEQRFFSGGSLATAIHAIHVQHAAGLYAANKEIYEMLCSGKSLEESLPDSTRHIWNTRRLKLVQGVKNQDTAVYEYMIYK